MPFLPLPTRPCSGGGSAAAMEPAGLEQILKELLMPDTERIRRVWAGPTGLGGWGGCGKGPVLTPPASQQATEQLQTALRDPAALPALCDLLASATDPQASYPPLLADILKFLTVPLVPPQPPPPAVLICSSSDCSRFSFGWPPLLTLDPPVCSGPDPQKAEQSLASLGT